MKFELIKDILFLTCGSGDPWGLWQQWIMELIQHAIVGLGAVIGGLFAWAWRQRREFRQACSQLRSALYGEIIQLYANAKAVVVSAPKDTDAERLTNIKEHWEILSRTPAARLAEDEPRMLFAFREGLFLKGIIAGIEIGSAKVTNAKDASVAIYLLEQIQEKIRKGLENMKTFGDLNTAGLPASTKQNIDDILSGKS